MTDLRPIVLGLTVSLTIFAVFAVCIHVNEIWAARKYRMILGHDPEYINTKFSYKIVLSFSISIVIAWILYFTL